MCGGEGSFTTARQGQSLGLLSLELFGGAPSSVFLEHTVRKLPSTKVSAAAPTDTTVGHLGNPCVVQKLRGRKMELNEVRK